MRNTTLFKERPAAMAEHVAGVITLEAQCGQKRGPAAGWTVWHAGEQGLTPPIAARTKAPIADAARWFLAKGTDPATPLRIKLTWKGRAVYRTKPGLTLAEAAR